MRPSDAIENNGLAILLIYGQSFVSVTVGENMEEKAKDADLSLVA